MQSSPSEDVAEPAAPRVRKAKVTPLPTQQLVAMTFVLVNESVCSTMLMPFVGPFVAFLRDVPVNEAGYYSGILVGMFMLGQVISAKMWGWISDQYGRRFPIISGLFTSGLMMLGFGLSTNVWMCAIFRFLHGLFNGNILVAKTMMADITDRTNQGGGFAFLTLCSAFGYLVGPTLGGLLYDPVHSKGLAWAHVKEGSFLGNHPAFLPSLVIFLYTNLGMLVCTFFVLESNNKAQPLPGFMKYIYPCMLYKTKFFVPPPIEYEDEEVVELGAKGIADARTSVAEGTRDAEQPASMSTGPAGAAPTAAATKPGACPLTTGCAGIPSFSPVAHEDDRRYDHIVVEELVVVPIREHYRSPNLPDRHESVGPSPRHSEQGSIASLSTRKEREDETASPRGGGVRANVKSGKGSDTKKDADAVPAGGDAVAASSVLTGDDEEGDVMAVTHFGYRQAFQLPPTRFMLSQYMVLCATEMVGRDCFPLWAVATVSVGGLGLSTSQVSYILLANSVPCLLANILFRIVERHYKNKMGLFRLGVLVGGSAVGMLPLLSYLPASFFVYVLVFLSTATRQIFCSWCYSLNTMLTARSAPPGHVGSIMGINQSCGALVRGIVPFFSAPLFAWSISGDHIFPFGHVFVFFLSAAAFYYCWWRSYALRTDEEGHLHMAA